MWYVREKTVCVAHDGGEYCFNLSLSSFEFINFALRHVI